LRGTPPTHRKERDVWGTRQPNIASVSIGGTTFRAVGVHFGISTLTSGLAGMPMMGSLACSIAVTVNLNDQANIPFQTLSKLFNLANVVTRDKIQDIVLTFWTDDAAQDAICTYSFRGWISSYVTTTGTDNTAAPADAAMRTNHLLSLTFQPELDDKQFVKIQLGN
jgi:hypothetical protein